MKPYQKEYLRKLGSRIEALQIAGNSLSEGIVEAAASARRIAHTLRGSGGTYGFPEISRLAEAVEEASADKLEFELTELIKYLRSLALPQTKTGYTILVIDDSEEVRLIVGAILERQGYHVLKADTAGQARTMLKDVQVSLILLDLVLPDTDGRNFLIELKEDVATSSIPVIVLSAKSSPQIKAECYALGAENYFEKPIDPGLLTTKVAATIQVDQKRHKDMQKDGLTGLINRAAFREFYEEALTESRNQKTPACLAIIDLDKFKSVNDQYGHLTGDAVLKYVTRAIAKILGEHDVFSRWGGEEFTILFPQMDSAAAKRTLDLAQDYLQAHPCEVDSGKQLLSVSFSAGLVDVEAFSSFDESFGAADKLLYSAKEAGRKCILTARDKIEAKQKSILLAEDDELTAEFIIHRLNRSGFRITHFPQGDEAYQAASNETFDLVITDVKMPGMDGFELVQRVRQTKFNQMTPIIILTSMGRESDISRGLGLGANDYILKPFSPTELLARVRRLLK